MCGIAGFQGNFDAGLLARMSESIAHRGPDGSGAFHRSEYGIGLAHRRLAIIDLSHAADQPMCDEAAGLTIVFNGEIYNYWELRTELVCDGYGFRTQSDTEVLLRLYARDGEAMLTRLNGIFAFAIWDAGKRGLFLARDGLGVKPLYYAAFQDRFAFASEIKALVHLMPQARELDPEALHRYLTFLWCPGEGTPLKQVRKLLPGEAMVVRAGRIERRWMEMRAW